MSEQSNIERLVLELSEGRLDRRVFLQRITAAGLSLGAANALAGGLDAESAFGSAGASRVLRVRAVGDVQNLDPAFIPGSNEGAVLANVYEGLVGFLPGTYKVVPVLAQTWRPSKDGLRYHFTLRKGVRFHGGYGELTAADVKFSFERTAGLTSPPIESPYQGDWEALREVRVTGRYSGTIILKHKFAPLLTNTLPSFSGYIVSRKAVAALGRDFAHHPIGTGPYEFVSWTPGQRTVLRRFSGYGGSWLRHVKAPIWSRIEFLPISLSNAATIAIQSGAVDWGPIGPEAVDSFKSNSRFRVDARTTLNYSWIGMNVAHPNLSNINVRRAIRYAIDVPSILEAAFDGKWSRARSLLSPGMPIGHWKQASAYKRDVRKAKSFLAKAGVKDLELTMAASTAAVGGATIAQIVQANLADIGIKVQVLLQDRSVFNQLGGNAQKNRQLFYALFTTPTPEPSFATEWFTCAQVNVWNWESWCNRQFSDWDAQAVRTLDPKARADLYIKMQKLWDKKVNAIWVAWPTSYFAGKRGIKPSLQPSGTYQTWDFRLA
jgi:peptide/nickel transport system substrate-binding protein